MKIDLSNRAILVIICASFLFNSCLKKQAFSAQDIRLNDDMQKGYNSGNTPDDPLFQYGQAQNKALDIVVPIDPSGTREIAKSHNYYISKGSQVEFNIETLIKFSSYEIDDDLEERGKLKIPSQWMSVCTFRDPITGKELKDTDGDDAKIVFDLEDASEAFTSYIRRCSGFQTNHPYLTEYGFLSSPCERIALAGPSDPFRGQNIDDSDAYPLCFFGGRMTLQESSSFSNIIEVSSYNDNILGWEDLTFQTDISPTFVVLDETVSRFVVQMTPDPDNAYIASGNATGDGFLRYEYMMPIIDGIYHSNFASDISVDYVRFYWTDQYNNLLPIANDPYLSNDPIQVQVNYGNKCSNSDSDGIFRASNCVILNSNTPAGPKGDLDNRVTWRLQVPYDSYNIDTVSGWSKPVVLEFGLKAD